MYFDDEVRVAGQELVAEGAVFVLQADFVGFVDYGADGGVFVQKDGGDEVFVGEVLGAEVEVGLKDERRISSLLVCLSGVVGSRGVLIMNEHGKIARTDVADDAESCG